MFMLVNTTLNFLNIINTLQDLFYMYMHIVSIIALLIFVIIQKGDTALHKAAKGSHIEVVKLLLVAQASINELNDVS